MTTYSPPQAVRALRMRRMTDLVIEAQKLHCLTEREGAPCIYHFDAHSQSLEKWAWPCLPNDPASPVPPDELERHAREFAFQNPCCPCAFVNEVLYTPTRISLLESVNRNKNDPLKRPFIGEYVAECATGTCGYFVVLERFYGSNAVPHRSYPRRNKPIVSLSEIMDLKSASDTPRGLRRILVAPAPTLGFSRGSTRKLKRSREESNTEECGEADEAAIRTLMDEGIPEAEFWNLFIQCAQCGHVLPAARYPYAHRCSKKGKTPLDDNADFQSSILMAHPDTNEARLEREEEDESDRQLDALRAAMFPRRSRIRGSATH